MAPSPIRSLGIRLRLLNYKVIPMKPELARFASELREALFEGLVARSDENREGFYDVERDCGCLYIHVYDKTRTVYLMARFSTDALVDRYEKPVFELSQSMAVAV